MKVSKKSARSKQHALPDKRFQDQKLTSHAGASILQLLFKRLGLKSRLSRCFGLMALTLVVHLFLGKRKLQDIRYYENDSLVCRLLCVENIPTCSTVSRRLAEPDEISVSIVRESNRDIILQRLKEDQLPRVTLDFDGSVLSPSRKAQGTAVGYNKKKKGAAKLLPAFLYPRSDWSGI